MGEKSSYISECDGQVRLGGESSFLCSSRSKYLLGSLGTDPCGGKCTSEPADLLGSPMLAFLISLPNLCLQRGNILWTEIEGQAGKKKLILMSAQERINTYL